MSRTQGFKRTGKNVSVSRVDLLNAVTDRLADYDSGVRDKSGKPFNPYVDPVYVKLADGKMVQVPRYVQNIAITKWRVMKNRSSPHTRMTKNSRYTERDPYIMNRDIKDVQGNRIDDDHISHGRTRFPEEMHELSASSDYERRGRAGVGQARVPDDRDGRGGAYGDLPRDYEIFNRDANRKLDDTAYVSDISSRRGVHQDGFYGEYDENDHGSHSRYDRQMKRRSDSLTRRPSDGTVSRSVVGSAADTAAEERVAETDGVEHYAPVDDNEANEADETVDNYDQDTQDCESCHMGDNRVIYRGQRMNDDADVDVDEEGVMDHEGEYADELDDGEYDDGEEVVEGMDDNGSSDQTYKYLFFLLLFIVTIVFLYNRKKHPTGSF
jgi:hypothetical protein